MRFSESEIVEDMLEHIRQAGGEFREWRVGTATTAVVSGQLSVVSKQAADGPIGDGQAETGLLCREAYTTFAAEEVVERLAGFGLQRERATTSNPVARPPRHNRLRLPPGGVQESRRQPAEGRKLQTIGGGVARRKHAQHRQSGGLRRSPRGHAGRTAGSRQRAARTSAPFGARRGKRCGKGIDG